MFLANIFFANTSISLRCTLPTNLNITLELWKKYLSIYLCYHKNV